MNIESKIREILMELLEIDDGKIITLDYDLFNFAQFDSFAQISLAACIESDFNILIDPDEFELFNSLRSIMEIIQNKLK